MTIRGNFKTSLSCEPLGLDDTSDFSITEMSRTVQIEMGDVFLTAEPSFSLDSEKPSV